MQGKMYTPRTYQVGSRSVEPKNTLPSLTVPDEAMTVQDIIVKYSNGIGPNVAREPIYHSQVSHDTPDYEAIGRSDFAERHEFAQANAEKIEQGLTTVRNEKKRQKDASNKAAFDSAVKAEADRRLKEAGDGAKGEGVSGA